MKRVYEFLKNAEVYYLATVEGDQPRVRPFGTVNIFEDKLYIQTGKVKPTSHQLAVLRGAKLVKMTRSGKTAVYSIADEHVRLMLDMAMLHIEEGGNGYEQR